MAQTAALALLLCSASAAVVEEVLHPIQEVSPDEFHALALRQEAEAGWAPPGATRNLPVEDTKAQQRKKNLMAKEKQTAEEQKEKEKQRKEKQRAAQKEKDQATLDAILNHHEGEEQEILRAEQGATDETEILNATMNPAKPGKSLACTEGKKQVLSFYISQLQGGVSTPITVNREKCLRAQLDQHCMPYESWPSTLIEPCDAGDWTCANTRVLKDHGTCLSKTVDWEAVQNHAKDSDKTMWEVLGSWCSHVKLLQEINKRIKLDEQFATDYPAILVLEDHVLLDKDWTEEVVKDWVNNYPHHWDMVQLHTFGGRGLKRDKVLDFRAKAVFKPSWRGQYNGAHAVLINTKTVPTLLERMMGLNVVPIEWLTKSLNTDPHGMEILSWDSGISTVAWEGSNALKEKMMPDIKACEAAKSKKDKY